MNTYKLLTPGPLTTTDTVKEEMLVDRCTWDDDYKAVTQKIRRQLLQLGHVSEDDYTAVLMQGSGTFGVESVLSSVVGDEDKVLICSNGAYGVRMTRICDRNRIPYVHYAESYDHIPDPARVARLLAQDPAITHVAMVHSETTSGILNDIQSVGKVVRDAGRTFIVDAMSSFGGVDIPVSDWGIDFLVSSANKCIQGVPGFSFILCRRDKLLSSEGKARSLSLDLLDQWKGMEKDGKWRFTSPTHVVLAFAQALEELKAERDVENVVMLMPGSHTHGIYIQGDQITGIISNFTGELFYALKQDTILSPVLTSDNLELDEAMVRKGIENLERFGFNRALYICHAMRIFEQGTPQQRLSYGESVIMGGVRQSLEYYCEHFWKECRTVALVSDEFMYRLFSMILEGSRYIDRIIWMPISDGKSYGVSGLKKIVSLKGERHE